MLDFKEIEKEMLKLWKDKKIYEKSKKKNAKGKKFYFLQGPPYTSGRLHIGHAWNNTMKDLALRFFRMKGHNVWDRAGYDMHGLPTENKVQENLGLKYKEDIEKYGVEKFSKKCMEFSTKNAGLMNEDLERLGIWMDFENAYMPVENDFMSNEWEVIKKSHEQGRLYKGKKIMHWCGNCETSLAKHELEYETDKDDSIFLKFKVKGKDDEYLIIWTTTPWTIPFNLAVMVNPGLDYVKIKVEGETWVVADALAGVFVSGLLGKKLEVIDKFKGKELEGLEYVHPLYDDMKETYDELKKKWPKVHSVILSEKFVDTSAGTGLVHNAPGCGPEDQEAAKEYGIGAFNTLNEKGELENAGKYTGWKAKVDDKKFIEEFKKKEALVESTQVEHEYPHCWRCHKPVVFKTTEQWFNKIEDLVPKILEYNKKINWVPSSVKNSYEAWITNLRDNGITRQRYWGTPAPIWECECGNVEVIGNIDELKKKASGKIPENLHRPWIDDVKIKCSKCKKEISRIPDVLDVWIDSGTTSWNCLYNDPKLIKEYFPADLIIEASEQARLWFSMLQIYSTIMFGKPCYEGVFGHGMILDFEGMKMSKSLGNVISPYEVIDKYSSEILRYYICETKAGENINFNWEDVKQKQRNLMILLNTSRYLIQLKKTEDKEKDKEGIEEKYMASRLNSGIKKITDLFEEYRFEKTITEEEKLFLDISRIYIQLTRDKSNLTPSVVFKTLKDAYVKTLQMFSTCCPLFCEKIWQQLKENGLVKEDSIHLTDWPKVDKKKIDEELEEEFDETLKIIEAGLAERDREGIGLKWPLANANVVSRMKLRNELKEIIARQLNVKKVELKKGKEIEVKMDFKLNDELKAEGYSREFARNVQVVRKKAGLQKGDLIKLKVKCNEDLKKMLEKHLDFLKERTNSESIDFVEGKLGKDAKEIKIKEYKLSLEI